MARQNDVSIGQELLNVPMGDMIKQMAFAIADAQFELDESSIRVAELMSGRMIQRDDDGKILYWDGTDATTITNVQASTLVPLYIDTRVQFGATSTTDDTVSPAVTKATPNMVSMFELGFSPTFYQFVDTIIEVKLAIKIVREQTASLSVGATVDYSSKRGNEKRGKSRSTTISAHVDASYSSKYSYSAEGSSLLRTKLVPLPPPAVFEERVRALFVPPAS